MELIELKFERRGNEESKSVEVTRTSLIFTSDRDNAFFSREDLNWIADCLAKIKATTEWAKDKEPQA